MCVPYFVRDLSIKSSVDEPKLSVYLREHGCQKQLEFGRGTLSVIDCEKAYHMLIKALYIDDKRFL